MITSNLLFDELCVKHSNKFVVDISGCWLWTASLDSKGYAHLTVNGKTTLGHRLFYEALYGYLPKGIDLHHKCNTRRCINPNHLEPIDESKHIYRHRKIVITEELSNAIVKAASNRETLYSMSRKFGLSRTTIWRELKRKREQLVVI